MVVENEVISQGFNMFAFICAIIVFFMVLLLIKKIGRDFKDTTEKVIALFVVPSLFGTVIYFIVNSMQ